MRGKRKERLIFCVSYFLAADLILICRPPPPHFSVTVRRQITLGAVRLYDKVQSRIATWIQLLPVPPGWLYGVPACPLEARAQYQHSVPWCSCPSRLSFASFSVSVLPAFWTSVVPIASCCFQSLCWCCETPRQRGLPSYHIPWAMIFCLAFSADFVSTCAPAYSHISFVLIWFLKSGTF